ncbi:MAG: tetratricopeptide repeat protein [Cyanobacteria bacterium P01_F01_bin.53]
MSRIFISYRREDSAGEAGRIYDYLERKFGQEAIFKDVEVIAFGDNFRDRIHEAVGQCQILLAIIGQRWLQVKDADGQRRLNNPADWVRLEIEMALNRNVRVIPILLDGVDMPAIQDLPTSLQPLCYRNAARVRHDPDFRKDIERVIRVIEQHSTEQPEAEQAAKQLFNSALVKSNLGNKRGAIEDFDKAIQLAPGYALAYNGRGIFKYELGDSQGAIVDYNKAIQLKPDDAITYYNRGNSKISLGDNQGAIIDYNKAIQLKPDYVLAYTGRGFVKDNLGDKQGAIVDYNKAIQLKPDYALAYNNRGSVKNKLGDQQGAIADYDTAIQLKPGYALAYNGRGNAKSDLGDKQGAIAAYKKAIHLAQQQGNTAIYNAAQSNLKLIS